MIFLAGVLGALAGFFVGFNFAADRMAELCREQLAKNDEEAHARLLEIARQRDEAYKMAHALADQRDAWTKIARALDEERTDLSRARSEARRTAL